MEIFKIEGSQNFKMDNLTFAELKIIRDACLKMGSNGTKSALEIARTIEKAMDDITI